MDAIEQKIVQKIDENREALIAFGRDIYTHAELGFKEFRSAGKFTDALKALNLPVIETGLALTGVKGYLKPKAEGPVLALIGELDALRIPSHACVNPETQAAHCCGHHAQLAGVVGAALALTDPEVAAALDGNVVFFAVPAEEYGEIAFKNQLREEGKIRYGGGKCELIRIGAFDDISLSLAHHLSNEGPSAGDGSSNGFVSKVIRILGRAAHAAGAPHLGVNALNAAALGHTALQYQRETFKDEDHVRVHPIITKGGDLVNVVPDEVVLEALVRAKDIGAIQDADRKTDRAYKAGADALGAGYEIETMPGYLPKIPTQAHPALLEALKAVFPGREIKTQDHHGSASTDVGDLQHIQPVLSFQTGGSRGAYHSPQFEITDEEEAYISTAKIFALASYGLLKDKAAAARKITAGYKPVFTRDSYIQFMESLIRKERKEVRGNE
ncbi:MAG: amidohydrolase [Spirochaetaceae bacterium]|jgi:amidohydrolase|nr:amidohydrolase [Spirochaetaceae bacterium]